jgi:hypothetical protein
MVRKPGDLTPRFNRLEAERRKLELSRAALARILGVDPITVLRQEQRLEPSLLWYYALRGVAAEAADKSTGQMLRMHRDRLEGLDQFSKATQSFAEERGQRFAAEKMRAVGRGHRAGKPRPAMRPKAKGGNAE